MEINTQFAEEKIKCSGKYFTISEIFINFWPMYFYEKEILTANCCKKLRKDIQNKTYFKSIFRRKCFIGN